MNESVTQMIPNATWTESSARPGMFLHQASGHNANVEWHPDGSMVFDTDTDWSVRMNSGGSPGPIARSLGITITDTAAAIERNVDWQFKRDTP